MAEKPKDSNPPAPRQRQPGQKGGGGSVNQTPNRVKSEDRGGKPYQGGAGTDKKPKKPR